MAAMASFRTRRTSLVIATGTAFAVVGAFTVMGTQSASAADCGAGAVIIVGGTNDPDAMHMIGVEQRYTGIGPDNRAGTADDDPRYTGTGEYRVIHADYPTTLWPLGAAGYDDSTRQGAASTARAISTYQSECGGKPVVVAGYSQGARVAGDVLAAIGTSDPVDADGLPGSDGKYRLIDVNGTPGDVTDDVLVNTEQLSGELYSDPRQAGDKSGRGIEMSLIGIIPGLTMSGPRGSSETDRGFGDLEDDVVSVCIEGDPICDLPDPIHDPIGAIDGLLGYFTKHGLYPFAMWRDPSEPWSTRPVSCDEETATVCTVAAASAFAELVQGWARDLGYTGEIGDFLSGRPTIGLPYDIELANLQPVVRLVQDLLPPLPKLGYGAYLPDLFVFEDILQGILTLSPAQFVDGATALAASFRSIVLLPVNFVRYWTRSIIAPVAPQNGTVTVLAADTASVRSSTFARLATATGGVTEPVRAEAAAGPETSPAPAQTDPTGTVPVANTSADTSDVPTGADDASGADAPDEDPAPTPGRDDEVPAATDPSGNEPAGDEGSRDEPESSDTVPAGDGSGVDEGLEAEADG